MRLPFATPAAAAALLLLLCLPAADAAAGASSPPAPSCAEGPATIGGTTYGTPCADLIVVSPGVEAVQGGGGDDTIVAAPIAASASCPLECHLGVGSQTFEGGPGDDVVYGERGNDTLKGGEGNDRLFGGIGDDLLRGGPGEDRLAGGFGADSIDGEAGDDYVHGDGTIDRIFDTGGGLDTLSYATGITPGFGGSVTGFGSFPPASGERGLKLELGAGGQNANNGVAPFGGGVDEVEGQSFETVIGTPFSDYIVGTAAAQTIYGGGGADVILGGGGGDSLDGGADGDYVDGGAAAPRDPAKVSVGLMAPGATAYSQLYLTGSSADDEVTATYAPGPPAAVSFDLAGSTFDLSPAADAGCDIATPTHATCVLTTPLDSIVLAGMGGDDVLHANGFPNSTTVVEIGGEGGDSLSGAGGEEVLVDGPETEGAGDDALSALAGDDALLHNGGIDRLLGGDGNDLFLSNSVCDGEEIGGGNGRDNASWARFGEGVEANLATGEAGRPGVAEAPDCGSDPSDSLAEVEDLEGSSSPDSFYGDAGPNQLLGHAGPDTYFAAAGADSILANSGDDDPTIDCGDDLDTALIDRRPQYDDAVPVACETVREADPNSFQTVTELPPPTPVVPVVPTPTPSLPTPKPPRPPVRRDTTPPQTRLLAHPARVVTAPGRRLRVRFRFRFASSEAGSHFRCRLDRRPAVPCRSPLAYTVGLGGHTLRVLAIDSAGNADPTPAVARFRVRPRA
jgi:Ca2+-binding RTX toxin-like protein